MNKIEEILDNIDDVLSKSWSVPLSGGGKSIVDVDKIKYYIDEIRENMPDELREAQRIVMDRKSILDKANREANATVKQAQQKAEILVENNEITKEAKAKSIEILDKAKDESKQIKKGAFNFSKSLIDETENTLNESLASVKKLKQFLRNPNNVK